tara:strand:+ start:7100 stop:7741 length:642 start_codon:yes stop_codon:yes gene_type:complete
MKKILVISQKGGSGKTMLATNLAVAYGKDVVLLDTDPQANSLDWAEIRKEKDAIKINSKFLNINNVTKELDNLALNNTKTVIIDTPPTLSDLQAKLIKHIDYILVPIMATKNNIMTIEPMLELIESAQKPFAFVISNAQVNTRMFKSIHDYISENGRILGLLKASVKMQEAELLGLGIIEHDSKHINAEEIVKIKNYINKTLKNIDSNKSKEL